MTVWCAGAYAPAHQTVIYTLLYQCDYWFISLCVDARLVCRSICSCIHEKLCVKFVIYKEVPPDLSLKAEYLLLTVF